MFRRMTLRILACAFVTLCVGGCAGVGDFPVEVSVQEQRVEGSPLGGLLGGVFDVPIPLDVDLTAETAARDTGPAQHVRLSELSLSITGTAEGAGDTDDFDFLDSAEIFVESAASGSSLPRVRVARIDPAPDGARSVFFETDTSVDLLPYVNEGARLTSSAEGRVPPDDVTFDGRVVLIVEVF